MKNANATRPKNKREPHYKTQKIRAKNRNTTTIIPERIAIKMGRKWNNDSSKKGKKKKKETSNCSPEQTGRNPEDDDTKEQATPTQGTTNE